jgi:hypothetical protein
MERRMTTRRAVLALLLAVTISGMLACQDPLVPELRYCGVDSLTVPIRIGGTTYYETLLRPRVCNDTTEDARVGR